MAYLMMMLGGLIPTFLFSRLFLWVFRSWSAGLQKIIVVHGIALLACSFIGGLGMADGGAFAGLEALAIYVVPQAFWMIVDVVRHQRRVEVSSDA